MYIVISYDVANDKKRTKVAKLLFGYGRRVQKSVFECVLDDKQLHTLKARLDKAIDPEVDSIRYYRLCQRCVSAIEITGEGTITEDMSEQVIIV